MTRIITRDKHSDPAEWSGEERRGKRGRQERKGEKRKETAGAEWRGDRRGEKMVRVSGEEK